MLLAAATGAAAGQPPAESGTDPGADRYGRTPEGAVPFRDFAEPSHRFFEEPVEFRGAGRAEEPAVPPETVRIGVFAPAGDAPDADLGARMLEGVTLAVEQANAEGGWRGIPFEIVTRPDLGLWGATSNEMVSFKYEDDVLAVLGSIDGANTHIALRVALKLQMPMVNTGTTDPTLTETNIPWLLRCMADDRQQGYALAHHVVRERGLERIVALRVNDRFGRMGIAEFRDAARRLGRPLRAELRWDRGERDFTAQLDRIAGMEADGIVIWGNAADAAAVVRAIRARGLAAAVVGCDRLASEVFLEASGDDSEGVVAAATFDPTRDDPRLSAFVEAYTARFGHAPETFAAHAFDGTRILVECVRRAGLNRARVRDALYEMYGTGQWDGVTGPVVLDATLNDVGPVHLAEVRDGRFVYREAAFSSTPSAATDPEPYRMMEHAAPVARAPRRPGPTAEEPLRIGCFLPLDAAGERALAGVRRAVADDAARHPGARPIELIVRDARGAWGREATALVEMIFTDRVLAVIGSTERRGTHLAETLAAKMHFPVVALCGDDPGITRIPLPWIFCVAPEDGRPPAAGLGYDAAALVVDRLRAGAATRRDLRDTLAGGGWHDGVTGTFRFDALGRRIDRAPDSGADMQAPAVSATPRDGAAWMGGDSR
jgi:ABC-type branched-subunit amino acid transport system substrate-binding protein